MEEPAFVFPWFFARIYCIMIYASYFSRGETCQPSLVRAKLQICLLLFHTQGANPGLIGGVIAACFLSAFAVSVGVYIWWRGEAQGACTSPVCA